MKEPGDVNPAADRPKWMMFLQAIIPFCVTMILGITVSAVVALFVYANTPDPAAHDTTFISIFSVGTVVSILVGYMLARRTAETEIDHVFGSGMNLLKKYDRAVVQPGADSEAGQYNIGERYLRDLLGRRGA